MNQAQRQLRRAWGGAMLAAEAYATASNRGELPPINDLAGQYAGDPTLHAQAALALDMSPREYAREMELLGDETTAPAPAPAGDARQRLIAACERILE